MLSARNIAVTAFAIVALSVIAPTAFAVDPAPGDACSTNTQVQWSGGPEASGKAYWMVCQGGAWTRMLETATSGYVGIRSAAPKTPLDVGGEMKIGDSSLPCGADAEGAIRYDATSKLIEYCNLSDWTPVLVNAQCDVTPAPFAFVDQKSLGTSVLVESDIIPINGTDPGCTSLVSISGSGSPEFRTCSDASCASVLQAWTSTNKTLAMNGPQYLQLRTTSPGTASSTHTVTITVGGVSDQWDVSTTSAGSCGDVALAEIGTVCSDGSVYAGISPDGNVNMYITRCDAGMAWDGANCTGTAANKPWNNGNGSNNVVTSATSSVSGASNTPMIIAIDSDSGTGGTQPHVAAQACADLTDHGNTDWYLPASSEMQVIYANLQDGLPADGNPDPVISGFMTSPYSSSTEMSSTHMRAISFSSGSGSTQLKRYTYPVRCARKD